MARRKHLFQFRQFEIVQAQTSMKVGTDGVLIGAWAGTGMAVPANILDIGSGTGLVALMLAQRFPTADILGVDIQEVAVNEAKLNIANASFRNRMEMLHVDFLEMTPSKKYDLIVSNPPYFSNSLLSGHQARDMSRHQNSLDIGQLVRKIPAFLIELGRFALILPPDMMAKAERYAQESGLYPVRKCLVSSKENDVPVRILQEWSNVEVPPKEEILFLYQPDNSRSYAYRHLTKDFYL